MSNAVAAGDTAPGRGTFYVTTPIYYVNDVPHIGHATTTVLADVLARFHRQRGADVLFLTGTDEHGQKVQRAAEERGVAPRAHCDAMVVRFQELWRALGISNDDFIRTTEGRHVRVVQEILADLHARGEIYKAAYEGWYCVPDERYWTDKDVEGGRCPDCGREVARLAEENYYFRMSTRCDWLVSHIEANPSFIQPESRRNEVLGFLRQPLGDLCISRPKSRLGWGIEMPFDPDYVTYVWFDALINYISALGYGTRDAPLERFWPTAHQLIGKDILTTHCVYWTTMLHAIGLPLPRTIYAHGWWTFGSQKMSKSLGNVVDPALLAGDYGRDALRYFLLREGPFGPDSDFSQRALVARINTDLANDLGNLFSRVIAMTVKYCGGIVPEAVPGDGPGLQTIAATAAADLEAAILRIAPQTALAHLWSIVRQANKLIDDEKPWALAKDATARPRLVRCLRDCLEALRAAAVLLWPFLPETAERMWRELGLDGTPSAVVPGGWDLIPAGTSLRPAGPLFPGSSSERDGQSVLIDTHAHLDLPALAADLPEVLERARVAGVAQIVNVSIGLAALRRGLEIAAANPGFITTTAGVHPHDTATLTPAEWDEIARLAAEPLVVAIGETGLDFHRDHSPQARQIELFTRHIDLARATGKPLVVHSRAATAATFAVLEQEHAEQIGGVLHCFSGTREDGERALALGFYLSLAGPLTYPRSTLPHTVGALPIERMVIETDAPYLAPQLHRGQRNEPAYLVETAAALAAIKGLAVRDIERITSRNACALFRLSCAPGAHEIAYPIRNSLYLNVTNRCTNRCTFCTRESAPVVKGHDLTLEREPSAREIISAAGAVSGYDEVVFCGFGEPLLRWDVVREVAREMKRLGTRVRINTNGQARLFLGRDILPEMVGIVDALSVSLNAPDAPRYTKICRPEAGEPAYAAVKEFIRQAQAFVPSVTASVVALPGLDIEACRRIAEHELGASFRVRPFNEVG